MRPPAALSAAAAVALLLAACSGDDDDAEPTTTPAVTPAPATTTPSVGTGATTPPAEPAFVFGFLGPGSSALAELATGQERGLALAIEDINAAGGVLGGPVAMVRTDEEIPDPDAHDDPTPTTAAGEDGEAAPGPLAARLDDLAEQGADAVVGPVGSASAVDVAPLVADRGELACSASATAVSVTAGNDVRSFFRTAMRDDDTAATVADKVMAVPEGDDPPATVMILGRDDTYGAELAGALAGQLTARGATVDTDLYPARRLEFDEEIEAVLAADPAVLVLASFVEGVELVDQLDAAGFPLDRIVGLDGLAVPAIAELVSPDDPTAVDGLQVIRSTGDRALTSRLLEVEAPNDITLYGAQMYDCAVTIALAAIAADTADPSAVGEQIQAVTTGGRTCSTFAHCSTLLAAGEDIDYTGPSGGLDIDAQGDISRALLTTSTVIDGELVDTATEEIDLIALRQQQLLAATIVTTQLQQALRLLGYYDGDVTGVFDEATAEAVRALQRDLGVEETGQYDAATDDALRARLGAASGALNLAVSQLQLELQELGYYDGPIDGRYSDATIAAVRAFQARLGVPQTGLLDTTTLRAVFVLGQQNPVPLEPPATTVPPETTAPPTTAAPAPPPPPPPAPTTTPTTEATTTTTEPPTVDPDPALTMWEVVAADPQFSQFAELLQRAGFDFDLNDPSRSFTVFAPTNAAFDALDDDELAAWTEDITRLQSLLAYHGVPGTAPLQTGSTTSIQGTPLDVQVNGSTITVNGGTLGPPTEASNGIVHAIDTVLIPPGG